MCLHVIYNWGPSAIKALRLRCVTAHEWLIIGIVIGFAGSFADNLYWGIAWHLDFIGHPARDWWFKHGSVSNVFFRQIMGIGAGLCHVISAYKAIKSKSISGVISIIALAILLGAFYGAILMAA